MVIRTLVVLVVVMLAGCCRPELIRVPVEVETVRVVVEPIPAELLRLHPADEADPDDLHRCPEIARERLDALRACNEDKQALRSRE